MVLFCLGFGLGWLVCDLLILIRFMLVVLLDRYLCSVGFVS